MGEMGSVMVDAVASTAIDRLMGLVLCHCFM